MNGAFSDITPDSLANSYINSANIDLPTPVSPNINVCKPLGG